MACWQSSSIKTVHIMLVLIIVSCSSSYKAFYMCTFWPAVSVSRKVNKSTNNYLLIMKIHSVDSSLRTKTTNDDWILLLLTLVSVFWINITLFHTSTNEVVEKQLGRSIITYKICCCTLKIGFLRESKSLQHHLLRFYSLLSRHIL